mmetsp:Transcript_48938/g.119844  ORF Transcript_48938/g.119844 Transcript_48938/m.119844 type:complete len:219 (+) Transcript_48938:299-955(+)
MRWRCDAARVGAVYVWSMCGSRKSSCDACMRRSPTSRRAESSLPPAPVFFLVTWYFFRLLMCSVRTTVSSLSARSASVVVPDASVFTMRNGPSYCSLILSLFLAVPAWRRTSTRSPGVGGCGPCTRANSARRRAYSRSLWRCAVVHSARCSVRARAAAMLSCATATLVNEATVFFALVPASALSTVAQSIMMSGTMRGLVLNTSWCGAMPVVACGVAL